MKWLWAVVVVAGVATAGVAAAAPAQRRPAPIVASFDCKTARSTAERIICGDRVLADKDRRVAELYRRAVRSDLGRDARENQRDWRADLNGCPNVQCVRDALDSRLIELEQAGL